MTRETQPALSGMSGTVAGYRLEGYIGRGDLAVVYLAQDERGDRQVALKILTPELTRDEVFKARFLSQSQAVAEIGHPHIIPIYEAGEANGALYVAMRYVQGGDARGLLGRLGPLPTAWAWNIIAQIASALDAAHARGLVHGDLKPASMLLDTSTPAGQTPRRADGSDFDHVYLSDFGMIKDPPGDPAATGQISGRLDYTAPEQIEGRALDGRADLYSLACSGYELLCGAPPFGQDQGLTVLYAHLYAAPPSAAAARPELPGAVDQVLARAMAKNPADRYPSCAEFAEDLHDALGLLPAEPATPGSWQAPGYLGPGGDARPGADGGLGPASAEPDLIPGLTPAGPGPGAAPAESVLIPGLTPAGSGLAGPVPGSPGHAAGGSGSAPGDAEPASGDTQPNAAAAPAAWPPGGQGPTGPHDVQATQALTPAPPDPDWATADWQQPVGGADWQQPGAPDWQQPAGGADWQQGPGGADWQQQAGPNWQQQTGGNWQQPPQSPPPPQSPSGGAGWQRPEGGPDWPQPAGAPGWQQQAGANWQQPLAGAGPRRKDTSLRLPGGHTVQLPADKRLVIGAGAVVVVIVLIVAIVAFSGGSAPSKSPASANGSSAPAASTSRLATQQASAVTTLLDSSGAARKSLAGAVGDVRNCKSLPVSVARIRRVVNQRNTENKQAEALTMSALTNGAAVKADLIKALHDSLSADRDYLIWARQQLHSGCKPAARSKAYSAAFSMDSQAATSKQEFVQVWNPLAAKYGARQETPGNI
ncbi:MAG TPA: protein kinase [Streptosporangiaceae bacterium]|nr:protein kinase [Streptosporangiaceae bacterium]